MLRGIAREFLLSGHVDANTISVAELRKLAWDELRRRQHAGEVIYESLVVDHTASILADAREHAKQGNTEYAFVFYALYVEHILNSAIRDRAFQLKLNEREAIDLMKRSLHEKTGLTWKLLFDEEFPPVIASDIRALASDRNAFAHYKWKPDGRDEMAVNDVKRETEQSLQTAERAAVALRSYVDARIADPDSEISEWINRPASNRAKDSQ